MQQLVCNQIMSIEHKNSPFCTRVFCVDACSFFVYCRILPLLYHGFAVGNVRVRSVFLCCGRRKCSIKKDPSRVFFLSPKVSSSYNQRRSVHHRSHNTLQTFLFFESRIFHTDESPIHCHFERPKKGSSLLPLLLQIESGAP